MTAPTAVAAEAAAVENLIATLEQRRGDAALRAMEDPGAAPELEAVEAELLEARRRLERIGLAEQARERQEEERRAEQARQRTAEAREELASIFATRVSLARTLDGHLAEVERILGMLDSGPNGRDAVQAVTPRSGDERAQLPIRMREAMVNAVLARLAILRPEIPEAHHKRTAPLAAQERELAAGVGIVLQSEDH